MSKYGVGVGEDFPVDEENRENPKPEGEAEDLGYGRHHFGKRGFRGCGQSDEWKESRHKARKAWKHLRHQMREEWHERRRAFRDHLNHRDGVEAMPGLREKQLHHLVIGGLAVVGLAALFGVLRGKD